MQVGWCSAAPRTHSHAYRHAGSAGLPSKNTWLPAAGCKPHVYTKVRWQLQSWGSTRVLPSFDPLLEMPVGFKIATTNRRAGCGPSAELRGVTGGATSRGWVVYWKCNTSAVHWARRGCGCRWAVRWPARARACPSYLAVACFPRAGLPCPAPSASEQQSTACSTFDWAAATWAAQAVGCVLWCSWG